MSKARLSILLTGLLALLSVGMAGCGGSEGSKASKDGTATTGKKGGSLTFLSTNDMKNVDPRKTEYIFDNVVQYAVHRPLMSYLPSGKAVPDAAKSVTINKKGDQVTVKLKHGIKFSPPVNREVTAKDYKYAIESGFTEAVASPMIKNYFSVVKGAPATSGKLKPISGLVTPNKYTLVIKLKTRTAATFVNALALTSASPVPQEWAGKFDKKAPSQYSRYVAFTGPYMIQNDPKTGKLVGHSPGRSITLIRNPNWDPKTDKIRPAYLNKITISIGNQDTTIAARRALEGKNLVCCDEIPPVATLKDVIKNKTSQYARTPVGTRWAFMNTTVEPFSNVHFRRAVFAAANRDAIRLSRGGKAVGNVAQHYIRPDMPGFKESGGFKGFKHLDFTQKPSGDIGKDGKPGAIVKKHLALAKKDGINIGSDNKYKGKNGLISIGANAPIDMQVAQAVQAQLGAVGVKLDLRSLTKPTMYNMVMNGKNHVAVGPNVGWVPDFSDGEANLNIFKGVKPGTLSFNFSQLNDPKINAAMDKAAAIPPGKARNKAWAKINEMIVAQAPAITFLWDDNYQLWSSNVKGVINKYTARIDLSNTSIKP